MNTEQIMALSRAYVMAVERRDFVEILTAKEALQVAITELVQERDEWKARTEFSFGQRDKLAAENKTLKQEIYEIRGLK